jgi:hypothetical protein
LGYFSHILLFGYQLFFPLQSFVADFASTSREDVFSAPDKVQLLNQVICQHFYRQGMLDIADELAQVMLLLMPDLVVANVRF